MHRLIFQKPAHFLSAIMALVSTFFQMFLVLGMYNFGFSRQEAAGGCLLSLHAILSKKYTWGCSSISNQEPSEPWAPHPTRFWQKKKHNLRIQKFLYYYLQGRPRIRIALVRQLSCQIFVTAKTKLERLWFSTSSSFVKIWSAFSFVFKAYCWTFLALYHLFFDLETIGIN